MTIVVVVEAMVGTKAVMPIAQSMVVVSMVVETMVSTHSETWPAKASMPAEHATVMPVTNAMVTDVMVTDAV